MRCKGRVTLIEETFFLDLSEERLHSIRRGGLNDFRPAAYFNDEIEFDFLPRHFQESTDQQNLTNKVRDL